MKYFLISFFIAAFVTFGLYYRCRRSGDHPSMLNHISITITTTCKGLLLNDMNTRVARVVQDAMLGIEKTSNIMQSNEKEKSHVTFYFKEGCDKDATFEEMRGRMVRTMEQLPLNAIVRMDTALFYRPEAPASPGGSTIYKARRGKSIKIIRNEQ